MQLGPPRNGFIAALIATTGILAAACTQNTRTTGVVTLVTHSSSGSDSDVFLREMARGIG